MRILVLGANGVIGKPLVAELKRRGYTVYESDIVHRHDEVGDHVKTHYRNTQDAYIKADISIHRQLDYVFQIAQPDIVYNLAAEVSRYGGSDYYENLWQTNLIGVQNILEYQKRLNFGFIHFSSSEVYGDYSATIHEIDMDRLEMRQLNEYGLSKWVSELLIMMKTDNYVIVRPFNVYGPGERYSPYRSVNIRFLWYAHHRIPFDIYTRHSRTFTYVDDCIRAIANIAERYKAGQTYNIAGNTLTGIEELAGIALELTGCDPEIVTLKQYDDGTVKQKKVNIDKAMKELDYHPITGIREGMSRTYEWLKKEYKL